jgi:mannosyltransferase OCH1-like enzyme
MINNRILKFILILTILFIFGTCLINSKENFIILQKNQYQYINLSKKKLKIPRKIWQTHKSNDLPKTSYKNINKIISVNKGYEYNFFDDNDMLEYLEHNFNQDVVNAYTKIKPGAGKADIWRLAVILKEGGIYLDVDKKYDENSLPLDEILDEDDEFVQGRNWHIWGFDAPSTNAILCARPNHPIIKKAFYSIINSINYDKPLKNIGEYKGWAHLEEYTGTPHLWKAISEHIGMIKIEEGKYKDGVNITNKLESNFHQNQEYGNDLNELGVSHWSSQEVFN